MTSLELGNAGLVVVRRGTLPLEAFLDALVLALLQHRRPLQLLLLVREDALANLPLLTDVYL